MRDRRTRAQRSSGGRRRWLGTWAGVLLLALLAASCTGEGDPDGATERPAESASPTGTDDRSPSDGAPDGDEDSAATRFPDETTTGVPADVRLEDSDSITVTEDGAVLDGLDIDGNVVVEADDVTIRRSRIRGAGDYAITMGSDSENLLVEDVEIVGDEIRSAAVCCSDYTLRRVNIHRVNEGPRVGGDVTIEDSYIHHLRRCTEDDFYPDYDDGCHIDALQSTGGSDIVIRGNNLQAYNPDTDDFMNAAFQFGEEQNDLRDVLFEGNLLNGGSYTVNGGGGGSRGGEVTFRDNRFGPDSRYGAATLLGKRVSFDDSNVWDDTGEPVDVEE